MTELRLRGQACREVRRRERTDKDLVESRARAEALAMEAKERKQEAFLAEQRMQRMDVIAKEQRVGQPSSPGPHLSTLAGEDLPSNTVCRSQLTPLKLTNSDLKHDACASAGCDSPQSFLFAGHGRGLARLEWLYAMHACRCA